MLRVLRILFLAQAVVTFVGTAVLCGWAGRYLPCPANNDCEGIREFAQIIIFVIGGFMFLDVLLELWLIRDNEM